jgi:hypothetical protein
LEAGPESEVAMKTIRLRQPTYMQVHVEDIARVESAVGDDRKKGTWVYLRDGSERRYCLETALAARQMIEEAKSREEIQLDAIAIALLLKAADKSADGRLRFTGDSDGLTVAVGGVESEPQQGRSRSKYEHAETQITGYALVAVESKGVYRLNERGYQMAEYLVAGKHPEDLPFSGYVKLAARFLEPPTQIGVQINQSNNNDGSVNNAISVEGDVGQSVK